MNTTQDVINILSKLSFNADNFEKVYYNMYIEETPMDITFRQYYSDGVINELTIPNVAKMKTTAYTSNGDPNGKVKAPRGSFCVDIDAGSLYYKREGSDMFGWIFVWTVKTLGDKDASVENIYLRPNDEVPDLTDWNMDNVNNGILQVRFGGTGVQSSTGFSGILKGNDQNPYTVATDSIDYLGVESSVGIIMFFPPMFGENGKLKFPNGWLLCDGSAYYIDGNYSRLYDVIGTAYGSAEEGTMFKVPNLIDKFIRCLNSTNSSTARAATDVQESQNKTHTHAIGTDGYFVDNALATHTHTADNTTAAGVHVHGAMGEEPAQGEGPFGYYNSNGWWYGSYGDKDWDNTLWNTSTNGEHSHSMNIGSTSISHTHTISGETESEGGNTTDSSTEFRVVNMPMVPLIKF